MNSASRSSSKSISSDTIIDTSQKKSTSQDRLRIVSTINEFVVACQRTKYQEAVIFHGRKRLVSEHPSSEICKKRRRTTAADRTWSAILRDLCSLMPLITDEEYSLISRLVSICLLAYLMPQTCNVTKKDLDENNLQIHKNIGQAKESVVDKDHGLLELEQILDTSPQIRHLPSAQINPCMVEDERISSPFWDFLHAGLGPFLSSRPMSHAFSNGNIAANANCGSADLLHVMSMGICSQVSYQHKIDLVGSDSFGEEVNFQLPERVRSLLLKRQAEYFQISPSQRAKLVHVVEKSMVLPKIRIPQENDSLLMGGVLHMRCALKSFSLSSLSCHQYIDARRALVWNAIDSECFAYVEMKALISSLVNNKSKRFGKQSNCRGGCCVNPTSRISNLHKVRYSGGSRRVHLVNSTLRQQVLYQKYLDDDICLDCAFGDLLCEFILRYNGSRHYADGQFTGQALAELTCGIATLLGQIGCVEDSEAFDPSLPTPCIIASLLDASRVLFYFLLSSDQDIKNTDNTDEEAQNLESGMKDALLDCVTQLLGSRDDCIASSAASFLALAFAYENQERTERLVGVIFASLKEALSTSSKPDIYKNVIEVLSRRSAPFATSMVITITDLLERPSVTESFKKDALRILVVISSAQPKVVINYIERVEKVTLGQRCEETLIKQLVAIYFSCYGLIYTMNSNGKSPHKLDEALSSVKNSWSLFQLGRLALSTANFTAAVDIFQGRLSASVSSASCYLWISSLAATAKCEQLVSQEGCSAIPSALCDLESALQKVRSMPQQCSFQIEFLLLRKDVLQLCLTVYNLCGEMRLTNLSSKHSSRISQHQKNVSRCFYMLCGSYCSLYKRYGMFSCQQTQSTIRTLFNFCKFLGDVARKCFFGVSSASSTQESGSSALKGNSNLVQTQIIEKLRSGLIGALKDSLEPSTRAEILRSVFDTMMRCPNPYPRDFTNLKAIPTVNVQVAAKASKSDETFNVLNVEDEVSCEVGLSQSIDLRLTGVLPQDLLKKSKIPFSQVMGCCSFSFIGPLKGDADAEDVGDLIEKEAETDELSVTAITDLLPFNGTDSKFIIDSEYSFEREGYYSVEVKLLTRDIRCGEYEIGTNFREERLRIACMNK